MADKRIDERTTGPYGGAHHVHRWVMDAERAWCDWCGDELPDYRTLRLDDARYSPALEVALARCNERGCGTILDDPACWHPDREYSDSARSNGRTLHYAAGVPADHHVIRVTHRPAFDINDFTTLVDCGCRDPEHEGHEYTAVCERCSYHVAGATMQDVLATTERDSPRSKTADRGHESATAHTQDSR